MTDDNPAQPSKTDWARLLSGGPLRLDNFDPDADDLRQLAEARLNGVVDGYAGADFTLSLIHI